MDTPILDSIAKEPPLLRWLHSHDPDRDVTDDLLASAGSMHSHIPQSETSHLTSKPLPPSSSLFVPMYRRKHFVLGQCYGPMSPNAMGLNLLAASGYGSTPTPISRRFVADLSFPTLDFLEYEWLSDGLLCVSIHHIREDGLYHGQSIVLDSVTNSKSPSERTPITISDLTANPFRSAPTKVVLRTEVVERLGCEPCTQKQQNCTCVSVIKRRKLHAKYAPPTNWHSWIRAMQQTRQSQCVHMSIKFTVAAPNGVITGVKNFAASQNFQVGVGEHAPATANLIKMFLGASGMMVSHPAADSSCRSDEEKRGRVQLANELSHEHGDEWPPPNIAVVHDAITVDGMDGVDMTRGMAGRMDGRKDVKDEPVVAQDGMSCVIWQEDVKPGAKGGKALGVSALSHDRGRPTKRRGKGKKNIFVCECGKIFNHRGHYNEHRLCVHERVRHHKCAFLRCQSRFFKKSDRDRHMRSKHDVDEIVCRKCDEIFHEKDMFYVHEKVCGVCTTSCVASSSVALPAASTTEVVVNVLASRSPAHTVRRPAVTAAAAVPSRGRGASAAGDVITSAAALGRGRGGSRGASAAGDASTSAASMSVSGSVAFVSTTPVLKKVGDGGGGAGAGAGAGAGTGSGSGSGTGAGAGAGAGAGSGSIVEHNDRNDMSGQELTGNGEAVRLHSIEVSSGI